MPSFTVPYTDASGNPRSSGTVTLQDSPNPGRPVVLLLHGNNGTSDDMINPMVHPGMNHDYLAGIAALVDRGWHGYPNVGVWGLELDPLKGVTSWQAALAAAGFGTAWYSQVDNAGFIATPARELAAVVAEILRRLPTDRRLALLAHSRGGLLARQFLVSNAGNAALRARLAMLITLHSPHLGTELAGIANALNSALVAATGLNPVAAAVLGWLQSQVNAPSYQEMAVGSAYLSSLIAAEAAAGAPIIPIRTFGGTSALLSRARSWVFTPGSAVPQVTSIWPLRVEFHWETTPLALPSPITGIPVLGLLAPELRDSVGDLLVTDARSRLPGERSHQTNRLNHAEALWDPTLQQQIIAALTADSKTANEGKEGKEKEKDRKDGDKLRKDDDKLRKDFDVASAQAAGVGPGWTSEQPSAPSGETGQRSFIRIYERPEIGRP
jgi:alpha-beta hydrolase superfamily lysophospholipase